MTYIIAAAVLGAVLGFFGCALLASAAIRRANREGYLEAMRFYARHEQSSLEREVAR